MGFRLCRLPEVHVRARYFKVLVGIEDPLDVLATGHVHDPEGIAALVLQHLRQHDCPKREEGLRTSVTMAQCGSCETGNLSLLRVGPFMHLSTASPWWPIGF